MSRYQIFRTTKLKIWIYVTNTWIWKLQLFYLINAIILINIYLSLIFYGITNNYTNQDCVRWTQIWLGLWRVQTSQYINGKISMFGRSIKYIISFWPKKKRKSTPSPLCPRLRPISQKMQHLHRDSSIYWPSLIQFFCQVIKGGDLCGSGGNMIAKPLNQWPIQIKSKLWIWINVWSHLGKWIGLVSSLTFLKK